MSKNETYRCLYCDTIIPWKGNSVRHKYCNNRCQGDHRSETWLKENKEKFTNGLLTGRGAIKKFVSLRDGYHCSVCGQLPEHNGKSLIMILDHIDGNASNNMPDNFRLVCPNCDTQLPTYKAKNMGFGRAARGMHCYSRL